MYFNEEGKRCGLIASIQKYTIHDGPGIRTEVFFKGCTLHCPWCSNPESIRPNRQIGIYPAKCISAEKCGLCKDSCPAAESPLRFDGEGVICAAGMPELCGDCLRCAEVCPADAITVWGKRMTAEELLRLFEKDRAFYAQTGGGITLSGGEVLAQWEFAAELLEACKAAGFHTCVESALHCPEAHLKAVLPFTDLFITDIKHMDPAVHKTLTGAGNAQILRNIRIVSESGIPLIIRTPVVPGYNDSEENMLATGAFIRDLPGNVLQYQLLPYRKMGTEKYASLGIPYPMGDYAPPERSVWEKHLLQLRDLLTETYGIPAAAGASGDG